jgi:hypothetical protein
MTGLPTVSEAPAQKQDRFGVALGSAAVGLGLFAFVADLVQGVPGAVLTSLTSSGFAWGLTAFLVGLTASTRRRAAIGGAALLVVATLLYYVLVLTVSRRWSGAYVLDPATGTLTPNDLPGLRSLAITTVLWLVGFVIAGPMLSLLGQTVRSGNATRAALAAGLGFGLLSGEGWYSVWRVRLWRLAYDGDFARGVAAAEVVKVLLPLAALVWLAIAHRLGRVWPVLLATSIVSAAGGALIWSGIEHLRYLI